MNKKNLLLTTGIAALAMALIALPSHSAPQEPQAPPTPEVGTNEMPEAELAPGPGLDREFRMFTSFDDDSGSWLGVETREVTADNVKEFKLPGERGVVIGKVLDDSPAAKAGLNSITRSFAFAYGPKVRVNCIVAGPFLTDISKAWDMDAFEKFQAPRLAMKRGGEPNEIVGAALFLASSSASFTTGTLVRVDGGTP